MKAYFAIFLSFILWSTSSAIVVKFGGMFPPFQSATLVISISAFFSIIFFILKDPKVLKNIIAFDLKNKFYLGLIGFFGFFLYPIFYFKGLHSNYPLEANVINYFWPIVGISLGFFLKIEKVTLKKILGILLGFLGVLITMSSLTNNNNILINLSFRHVSIYIFAALGAISYGVYTALFKKHNIEYKNSNIIDIRSKFLFFLMISLLFHILFNIINFTTVNQFLIFEKINIENIIYLFIYAIFNFSIAYFCWAYALEKLPLSHVTIMAFIIPAFSTIILVFWNNIKININSIYGLVLITSGLYIHQDHKRYITPLAGMCISFVIFSLLTFFVRLDINPNENMNIINFLAVLVAIFSILVGFILSRVIKQFSMENKLFILIEGCIVNICNIITYL